MDKDLRFSCPQVPAGDLLREREIRLDPDPAWDLDSFGEGRSLSLRKYFGYYSSGNHNLTGQLREEGQGVDSGQEDQGRSIHHK